MGEADNIPQIIALVSDEVGGVLRCWESISQDCPHVKLVRWRKTNESTGLINDRLFGINLSDSIITIAKIFYGALSLRGAATIYLNDEIGVLMAPAWPTRPRTIFVLHGNHSFYYDVALRFSSWIDYHLCVSDQAVSYLGARGLANVELFSYSINLPLPDPSVPKDLFAIYVGRFVADKNVGALLPLFDAMRDAGKRFAVLGSGPLEAELRLNLRSGEVMANPTREEVLGTLSRTRFVCLPSYVEGLPIVYLEAAHYGAGVVCSYVDRSSAKVLSDNYIILGDSANTLQKMLDFEYHDSQSVHSRVNCPSTNLAFIQRVERMPVPNRTKDRYRYAFRDTLLHYLPQLRHVRTAVKSCLAIARSKHN